MLNNYFYSHLVDLDSLFSELDVLDLTAEQKKELKNLAREHVHQTVIDTILSQLSETDKKRFLELVALGESEKIWKHLNEKAKKVEEKIRDASEQIKKELKEDIAKVKK